MATVNTLQLPFILNPPGVSAQRATLASNPYFQYFGVPQTYQPLQSYEGIDQTMRTFPEAVKGESAFLGHTFTLLALTQNSFLTSVILPLKHTDQTHYSWSQTIFHPYLPERVPHLGVVRFVKSQEQAKSQALTRYGIGMTLEHGFMETEKGRQHYMMEIRQITQAVNENLQAEALFALMNSQTWELNRLRQMQGTTANVLNTQHVDAIIQRELDTWAYMQQNRHAWFGMNDHVARAVETYSQANFNAWIIDIRVDSFRKRVAEDQTTYAIHGPGFLEGMQQGAQHYQVDNGKIIYATRSFLTGERPVNPLETVAQIGEYFRCADLPDMNFSQYDSSYRTQKFYNEDGDVMSDITLREKLEHCHRFRPDGTLMTFKDLNIKANLDDEADKKKDFLHYTTPDGESRPLSLFGQLRRKHFNKGDYRDLARTVFGTLARTSPYGLPAYEKAFATIRKYLDIMNNVPYNSRYEAWVVALSAWNTGVATTNTGSNAHLGAEGSGDIASNTLRSLDVFPAGAPDFGFPNFGQWTLAPPTHGTYGGFKTIQRLATANNAAYNAVFSATAAAEISEAMDVFDQFVTKVSAYFPKSLVASPAFVSANIHSPSAHDAVFENLLCRPYPSRPLFVRPLQVGEATTVEQAVTTMYAGNTADKTAIQGATIGVAGVFAQQDRPREQITEALYPSIQASLTALFRNVTGELEVLPAGATGRATIGLAINAAAAPNNVNIVAAPNSTPTPKAANLSTLLTPANLNRLKLWMMTPADSVEAAAAKAKILLFLACIDTSSWKENSTNTKIVDAYARALDALDSWVGPIAGFASEGALSQALVAANSRLANEITSYFERRQNSFVAVTGKTFNDIFPEIDKIARKNAATRGAARPTQPTGRTYDDVQNFRAAPVRIGRVAYLTWLSTDVYGSSRFLPGGERFAHEPLSQQEFILATDPSSKVASNQWGSNYADSDGGSADLLNLPLIANAITRLSRGNVGAPYAPYSAPEYSTRAPRYGGGMPSINGEASSKRSRYGGMSYDSDIVGNSRSPKTTAVPAPEFHSDDLLQELPNHMKKMFSELCSDYEGELGTQIVAIMFMFTPVTRQALEATITYDLLHPFDYIIARPHATYRTVASIALQPGEQTGNTLIGNVQVTVSNDNTVQVLQAAIRFYQTAIIKEPKNIYVVPNSMVVGYYHGLGAGFISPDHEKYDPRVGVFGETRDASIIVIALPRHERIVGKALALSGRLLAVEPTGRTSAIGSSPRKYSYNTAAFYIRLYRFYMTRWNDFEYTVSGPGDLDLVPNTVCFSSLAVYRDPKSGQWTAGTSNCGHWHTDTVGPGMAAARIGHKSFPLNSQPLANTMFSF